MKEDIKTKRMIFKVSLAEKEQIKEKAALVGLSASSYMRKTALQQRIIIKTDKEMIRQIRYIGNNINQIAHNLNMFADGLIMADAYEQMKEYKKLLECILKNIKEK